MSPILSVALRKFESLLRQTEILYSFLRMTASPGDQTDSIKTHSLSHSRETLSWLLHHDAITGGSSYIV